MLYLLFRSTVDYKVLGHELQAFLINVCGVYTRHQGRTNYSPNLKVVSEYLSKQKGYTTCTVAEASTPISSDKALIKHYGEDYMGCIDATELEKIQDSITAQHVNQKILLFKRALPKVFGKWDSNVRKHIIAEGQCAFDEIDSFLEERSKREADAICLAPSLIKCNF